MANYPARVFYGTPQTVIDTATDIASGDFSGAPAATFDNTSDSAVPHASHALVVGQFPDWAAAPGSPNLIELYGVLKDVDGTNDETNPPSGSSRNGAHFFGEFEIVGTDALQRRAIVINILGLPKIDFYIKNNTSQSMNNDAGTNCKVIVTPIAQGVVV